MAKATGTVKWFDEEKGFGFITPNDGSPDVFFHVSSLHCDGFVSLPEGKSIQLHWHYLLNVGGENLILL